MTERTTIRLPEDLLLNRARRKAVAEGRSLTSLIEDGLRAILSDSPKLAKRKRVALRISEARGGLMPGIDLTDPGALQDGDDFAYVLPMRRVE